MAREVGPGLYVFVTPLDQLAPLPAHKNAMAPPNSWTQDVFAVYVPAKWSSNVFNLPRRANKDRMAKMAQDVQERLSDALIEMRHALSDEVPNITNHKKVEYQWAWWSRDAQAQSELTSFLERVQLNKEVIFNLAPQDKHASIAVGLGQQGIWVGLRVAPSAFVDRKNLRAKLMLAWERERLLELVRNLPESMMFNETPVRQVDQASIASLSNTLEHGGQNILAIGESFDKADVVALQDNITEAITDAVSAVLPLYRFVAWRRDNDLIDAAKTIQDLKQQRRKQAASYKTGDKVRFVSGLFVGRVGFVVDTDTKAQVRVKVGAMAVSVSGSELSLAP